MGELNLRMRDNNLGTHIHPPFGVLKVVSKVFKIKCLSHQVIHCLYHVTVNPNMPTVHISSVCTSAVSLESGLTMKPYNLIYNFTNKCEITWMFGTEIHYIVWILFLWEKQIVFHAGIRLQDVCFFTYKFCFVIIKVSYLVSHWHHFSFHKALTNTSQTECFNIPRIYYTVLSETTRLLNYLPYLFVTCKFLPGGSSQWAKARARNVAAWWCASQTAILT